MPWFGVSDHGGGYLTLSEPLKVATAAVTISDSGSATKMRGWVGDGGSARMMLYAVSGGAPGALLASSASVSVPTGGGALVEFPFTTPYTVTGGTSYFLAIFASGGGSFKRGHSTASAATTYYNSTGVTDPFGSPSTFSSAPQSLEVFVVTASAPVADFSATPTSGTEDLAVAFTDLSSNTPTSWAWTFGDGGTSTAQNPSHNYTTPGTYTVALVATNAAGSDTETKTGYITITAAMPTFDGRVNVAFDGGLLEWMPEWTALDQLHPNLITSWTVDRGRAYELDRTEGGRATVEILDPDGVLDPTNPASPYASMINPLLQVCLCRRDPMEEEWQPRFRGWISDLNYVFDPSQKVNRITLELVDIFELLGAIEMQVGEFGDSPPEGSEGQIFFEDGAANGRIIQVLENAGPPPVGIPPDYYVVFSMNVLLTQSLYSVGETPLEAIQDVVDAEWSGVGNVFTDRHGRLNAHGRYARFDPAAVIAGGGEADRWDFHHWQAGDQAAVEADPGAVAQLREFAFNRGVSKIINHASAYPQWILDGAEYRPISDDEIAAQTVRDDTSIGIYGLRSWSAQNLQTQEGLVDSADGLVETKRVAQYYVDNMAEPRNRITGVGFRSIHPGRVGSGITWQLLSRIDISDQIDITIGSPGGGGFAEVEYYVEGIHETSKPLNPDYDDDSVILDLSPKAYFDENPFPVPE